MVKSTWFYQLYPLQKEDDRRRPPYMQMKYLTREDGKTLVAPNLSSKQQQKNNNNNKIESKSNAIRENSKLKKKK